MTRDTTKVPVRVVGWPGAALAIGFLAAPALAQTPTAPPAGADFRGEVASTEARRVADWALAGDSGAAPFIIIDKVRARVFVFDKAGRLKGAASALLGKAYGDDTVPGIGHRRLSTIRLEERTTPAGRFVAVFGRDFEQDVLWLDYDAGLSLHRVIFGEPGDRRLQRLATASALDKRVSYGCINVPVTFYEKVVVPDMTGSRGIVYILPETKTVREVFQIPDALAAPSPGA